MDLKKRLASLDRLSRRPAGPNGSTPRETGDVSKALGVLGLTESQTTAGKIWIREYTDPVAIPPGELPDLTGFFTHPSPDTLKADQLLLLDTETTGLAGGTGTIPFLVGASWWEEGALRTRQYFLPGPGREGAMLADLAAHAERFAAVVTFNGASFDLPLLRTRARLVRREDPLKALLSWDLLVPCRRLWGRGLPDCRQQTLEREILGRQRGAGDIDGSRIPQTWFDFPATGQPGDLVAVLTHNHRDMLGMAGLLRLVLEEAIGLPTGPPVGRHGWRGAWSRGRICEVRRDQAGAGRWMGCAVEGVSGSGRDRDEIESLFRDAIRILKRSGDWPLVEKTIEAGFSHGLETAWMHREAAILFEHRLVRLDSALHHARLSDEDRRLKRLEMKISRRYGSDKHSGGNTNDD